MYKTHQRRTTFGSWDVEKVHAVVAGSTSHHNGVHFFDISTSESGPGPSVFYTFDLEMCFAPERLTSKAFCAFWLGNVLRAATACTFSTSQLLTVLRSWSVLYIFASKCAPRHNGVQFFISHLAKWLRTRRFSEPTFRPPRATNRWKNKMDRDFPIFSRTCVFFLLTLSLLWSSHFLASPLWLFSPLLFHLSILSEVWLLNFLRLVIWWWFNGLFDVPNDRWLTMSSNTFPYGETPPRNHGGLVGYKTACLGPKNVDVSYERGWDW